MKVRRAKAHSLYNLDDYLPNESLIIKGHDSSSVSQAIKERYLSMMEISNCDKGPSVGVSQVPEQKDSMVGS